MAKAGRKRQPAGIIAQRGRASSRLSRKGLEDVAYTYDSTDQSGFGYAQGRGLKYNRVFSKEGVDPFSVDIYSGQPLEWERRKAKITDDKGNIIFEQEGVEVPRSWSQLALNVVASKYLYGDVTKKSEREDSVRTLVWRVAEQIRQWGIKDNYFATLEDANAFADDLTALLINQHGSFNSPVWFNAGIPLSQERSTGKTFRNHSQSGFYYDPKSDKIKQVPSGFSYHSPQCSACFIQHVDDKMESIMNLAKSEAMLFKFGSGTGTDLSTIRSAREKMSGGGKPSGPLSFLKVYDAIASVVKSGGKTRRAAKMNTLKVWHPDIKEFIEAKSHEERKAWALIEQGYAADFNSDAYGSVMFQNENLSVRVTDKFMEAVRDDKEWQTHWVTDPSRPGPVYKARDLAKWISEGAWLCGDPGVQYEDTIQKWHTCKVAGPINSSNPCSEYMFLDDTACNLASLNLKKFMRDGKFDAERLKRAVDVFITAQDILVDNAQYPTYDIAERSHIYRTLGLGYANLGGLEMELGLPYDSDESRAVAGSITAMVQTRSLSQSAKIAATKGAFKDHERNKESMAQVVKMHRDAVHNISRSHVAVVGLENVLDESIIEADRAIELGSRFGYRNAQVTVLAPTGTIGFAMDCDTTGVEPDIALVKYKLLAGGGMLKIVNGGVRPALKKLEYSDKEIEEIVAHIDATDTIEGAPGLKPEHLPVFDCAFKPKNGERYIHHMGHIKMMAAVQPFLSGAISKTVNLPNDISPEEIRELYMESWKLGLKALAVYRDGCKRSQPVSTGKSRDEPTKAKTIDDKVQGTHVPIRRRMPTTRPGIIHKFAVGGHEGYLTVGLYDHGRPGELFITMAKEGSTVGGLMDAFGTAISMGLQYGVPLEALVKKFRHMRFDPSGFTGDEDIPNAKSIPDYIFTWLDKKFLSHNKELPKVQESIQENPSSTPNNGKNDILDINDEHKMQKKGFQEDAPACDTCGSITIRSGSCYKCDNCGNSMGCS